MTREEAVKIIRKYECNSDHYKACEMAIRSLEAWDKVKKEIDEATEIHTDGEFYIKNIDVTLIIHKHMKEVEE